MLRRDRLGDEPPESSAEVKGTPKVCALIGRPGGGVCVRAPCEPIEKNHYFSPLEAAAESPTRREEREERKRDKGSECERGAGSASERSQVSPRPGLGHAPVHLRLLLRLPRLLQDEEEEGERAQGAGNNGVSGFRASGTSG